LKLICSNFGFIFGIAEGTLTNFKKKHPELLLSIKKGKEVADNRVEQALFERAIGYSHPDTYIFLSHFIITLSASIT
jgi:hypothetical protein